MWALDMSNKLHRLLQRNIPKSQSLALDKLLHLRIRPQVANQHVAPMATVYVQNADNFVLMRRQRIESLVILKVQLSDSSRFRKVP